MSNKKSPIAARKKAKKKLRVEKECGLYGERTYHVWAGDAWLASFTLRSDAELFVRAKGGKL